MSSTDDKGPAPLTRLTYVMMMVGQRAPAGRRRDHDHYSRRLALGLLASAAVSPGLAQGPRLSNERQDYLKTPAKLASIKGPFSLMAIGDMLNSRPTADNPDVPSQKALAIVRGGDVAIGNREGVIVAGRLLDRVGIVHPGSGMTLAQARKAKSRPVVTCCRCCF